MNLTHRDGHEHPEPLEPGRRYTVTVKLDSIAHAFPAGHRLRVAVSTDYWPWVWPSPEAVTLSVFTGGETGLVLPVRAPRADDELLPAFETAETHANVEMETITEAGSGGRKMIWDVDTNTIDYEFRWVDGGRFRLPQWDIVTEDHVHYYFKMTEGDPLSASSRLVARSDLVRGDELDAHVETECELRSDTENFYVTSTQHVFDHGTEIFTRTWEKTIPRDLG